jgi:probable F420-dependent oxidoreductase
MTGVELIELAKCADELGFDALWLGEHVLRPGVQTAEHPSTGTTQHHTGPIIAESTELIDPWAVHSAISAVTTRLKLGTAVYLAPLRHPLQTARTTITVQELSGGRIILGVGAGWLKDEFDALGIPFAGRVSRTEECIEILRKAWSGTEFEHHGRHFQFSRVQLHPRPVRIPVVLGGNGPKALARAAALGDGWFTSGTPDFDEARAMVDDIDRLRAECGSDGEFTCYVRVAGPEPDVIDRYRGAGMSDLVLWADTLWTGDTIAERRDSLTRAAIQMGVAG